MTRPDRTVANSDVIICEHTNSAASEGKGRFVNTVCCRLPSERQHSGVARGFVNHRSRRTTYWRGDQPLIFKLPGLPREIESVLESNQLTQRIIRRKRF